MDKIEIQIRNEFDGLTIKELLKEYCVGKGKIEELRNNSSFFINKEKADLNSVLSFNDKLEITIQEKVDKVPSSIEAEVLYEDDYVLVVNKPTGIIIHDDGTSQEDTLEGRVAKYYYNHKIFRNVRYVHRIDKDTSGIVLFAKDFITHALLSNMLEHHDIERKYKAICLNRFSIKEGIIDKPIASDRHVNNKYRVAPEAKGAKKAYTTFKVEKFIDKKHSLVELLLKTGRTHQIRVHMSYIGHPLSGDNLYGGEDPLISRVALHSYSIKLLHPIFKEFLYVECPLPEDMESIVRKKK